jgi:hypothetical protein
MFFKCKDEKPNVQIRGYGAMKSVAIISTPFFSASISSGIAGSDIELHFPKMGAENGKKTRTGSSG